VRHRAAAAAALVAVGLAAVFGCGGEAADLFEVRRAGEIPGAALRLRVVDDGRASCNGAGLVQISSDQLIAAREIARDLEEPAAGGLVLPARPGSVLRYRVRLRDGAVRWADTSRGQPQALFRLAKLTRDVARGPCGLAR